MSILIKAEWKHLLKGSCTPLLDPLPISITATIVFMWWHRWDTREHDQAKNCCSRKEKKLSSGSVSSSDLLCVPKWIANASTWEKRQEVWVLSFAITSMHLFTCVSTSGARPSQLHKRKAFLHTASSVPQPGVLCHLRVVALTCCPPALRHFAVSNSASFSSYSKKSHLPVEEKTHAQGNKQQSCVINSSSQLLSSFYP